VLQTSNIADVRVFEKTSIRYVLDGTEQMSRENISETCDKMQLTLWLVICHSGWQTTRWVAEEKHSYHFALKEKTMMEHQFINKRKTETDIMKTTPIVKHTEHNTMEESSKGFPFQSDEVCKQISI
jgi:hypothetical protein